MLTYNIETSIGQVRFNLSDTNFSSGKGIRSDGTNYTDEEIAFVLEESGDDVKYATYDMMMRLSAEFAAKATAVEFGAFRQENENTAASYQRAAMTYLAKLKDEEKAGEGRMYSIAYSTSLENEVVF